MAQLREIGCRGEHVMQCCRCRWGHRGRKAQDFLTVVGRGASRGNAGTEAWKKSGSHWASKERKDIPAGMAHLARVQWETDRERLVCSSRSSDLS